MKKIKILNSDGKSNQAFESEINHLLSKGWKIKGNMINYSNSLALMMYKK